MPGNSVKNPRKDKDKKDGPTLNQEPNRTIIFSIDQNQLLNLKNLLLLLMLMDRH